MALAAGVDLKVVPAIAGHATALFTADQYLTVGRELKADAASKIGGFVPRASTDRANYVPTEGEDHV
jgi:hypothetical protein